VPVDEGYEKQACGQQPAGEMVGQGQSYEEGREQGVTFLTALSPEKEYEQGEGDKQGVQGIDLGDNGLGPARHPYPEGEGGGRSSRHRRPNRYPAAKTDSTASAA
jgi:hypothetical protein